MFKYRFKDFPTTDDYGHFTFLDDYAEKENTFASDGFIENSDKFDNKSLFTVIRDHEINKLIVNNKISFPAESSVSIKKLEVKNAGVNHRVKNSKVIIYLFDNYSYNNGGGGDPESDSYTNLSKRIPKESKIYSKGFGTLSKGKSPGVIMEDIFILNDLNNNPPTFRDFEGDNDEFNPTPGLVADGGGGAFSPTSPAITSNNGASQQLPTIFELPGNQKIYFVVWTKGDAKKWWGTDIRKKRYHVFSIKASDLFDNGDGTSSEFNFTYANATIKTGKGGKGGAEAPAFKVSSFKIKFETRGSIGGVSNNTIIKQIQPQLKTAERLSTKSDELFDKTFLLQNPENEIIYTDQDGRYGGSGVERVNYPWQFEPITDFQIAGIDEILPPRYDDNNTQIPGPDYDLSVYHKNDEYRQICSAPNQVRLGFRVGYYDRPDVWLNEAGTFDDKAGNPDKDLISVGRTGTDLTIRDWGFKFYVVSWDDVDNQFENVDDFLSDIPNDVVGLKSKRVNNLYKFSEIRNRNLKSKIETSINDFPRNYSEQAGNFLYHNYSTSGVKNVKIVMFSYTKNPDDFQQIIRWKFIHSRIFVDIPINQYPDFPALGGADYVTLPFPYIAPVIGGVDENSKFNTAVNKTLSGGKIGNNDIIDQQLLFKFNKDKKYLGKSINKLNLAQVRFFNTGSFDMHRILGIENNITTDGLDFNPYTSISSSLNSNPYWDGIENSFPEESSVGKILIGEVQDSNLNKKCMIELNCGELNNDSINNTAGVGGKGVLMGDYNIKKTEKNRRMTRNRFIKLPKKDTIEGAF